MTDVCNWFHFWMAQFQFTPSNGSISVKDRCFWPAYFIDSAILQNSNVKKMRLKNPEQTGLSPSVPIAPFTAVGGGENGFCYPTPRLGSGTNSGGGWTNAKVFLLLQMSANRRQCFEWRRRRQWNPKKNLGHCHEPFSLFHNNLETNWAHNFVFFLT